MYCYQSLIALWLLCATCQSGEIITRGGQVVIGGTIPVTAAGGGATATNFLDTFNRTGDLAGSSPNIGGTWSQIQGATTLWTTASGTAQNTAGTESALRSTATISSGHVYTLTVTATVSYSSSAWCAVGFDNGSQTASYDAKGPWMLVGGDGGIQAFYNGTGTAITLTGTANGNTVPNDLKIVLDTTGSPWTCQIWVNGTQRGSSSLSGGFTATHVMVSCQNQPVVMGQLTVSYP